jgi:hypothetical protein
MEDERKEQPDGKKKLPKIEITELFMAKKGKKGWDTCFHGVIRREKDKSGKEIAVNGNIYMDGEGVFWSRDTDQDKYGENIDGILELRIDYGIHKDPGVFSEIARQKFFHN